MLVVLAGVVVVLLRVMIVVWTSITITYHVISVRQIPHHYKIFPPVTPFTSFRVRSLRRKQWSAAYVAVGRTVDGKAQHQCWHQSVMSMHHSLVLRVYMYMLILKGQTSNVSKSNYAI